jgi:hypothetical protein
MKRLVNVSYKMKEPSKRDGAPLWVCITSYNTLI